MEDHKAVQRAEESTEVRKVLLLSDLQLIRKPHRVYKS